MKFNIYITLLAIVLLSACKQKSDENVNNKELCWDKIPDISLSFTTSSSEDLHPQVSLDSMCTIFFDLKENSINGIYGKTKVNDSIYGVIYLYAGDSVLPYLVTFKNNKIVDKAIILNIPGGSTGEGEDGSSTLVIKDKETFMLTDTINSYTFDPERGGNIQSTKQTRIEKRIYKIGKDAKIIEEVKITKLN